MKRLLAILMLLALFGGPPPAWAHKPSDSYLTLRVAADRIDGQWDIALRDLDFALGLDANGDGQITWGEVRAQHASIAAYALSRLDLVADGQPCPTQPIEHLVDSHSDGSYAVLRFSARCPAPIRELAATYRLFFDLDRQHKGLLGLQHADTTSSVVFTPEKPTQVLVLAQIGRWQQFAAYLSEGVWHIWIGIDHIMFLVSLLLPAVMLWQARRWAPVPTLRAALIEVLKIVTAFTLAHSITLSLATLGVVELPSRLVESAIALSVVLAALNNLAPRIDRARWAVAFGFGLIHGFGFASVLADLGLPAQALVLALVGFNIGVEIGQLAIVSIFLPIAFLLRKSDFYRRFILRAGSMLIAVVAGAWLVERAFNLKFMPF